jgi:hypothetical protein
LYPHPGPLPGREREKSGAGFWLNYPLTNDADRSPSPSGEREKSGAGFWLNYPLTNDAE